MATAPQPPYSHVRALTRGLDLLSALNQLGLATAKDLSAATGIDRGSTYRLLSTLCQEGFVTRSSSSEFFRLTAKVRQLSSGFIQRDALTRIVAPEMGQLLGKVLWPSDFAVFEDGEMVIRESTHAFSPFSIHRAMIGRPRPVMKTALGRAVLASVAPRVRQEILRVVIATGRPDAPEAANAQYVKAILAQYRDRGYAMSVGAVEDRISAIALPVRVSDAIFGSINIIFFRSALSCEEASKQFLPILSSTVQAIEEKCRGLAFQTES